MSSPLTPSTWSTCDGDAVTLRIDCSAASTSARSRTTSASAWESARTSPRSDGRATADFSLARRSRSTARADRDGRHCARSFRCGRCCSRALAGALTPEAGRSSGAWRALVRAAKIRERIGDRRDPDSAKPQLTNRVRPIPAGPAARRNRRFGGAGARRAPSGLLHPVVVLM